ncbi:DUF2264 domain-containing protein [Actinomadura fulvescens]|uniref:DUF2264 domain-containing protein n=1 Tax=Actinomadura fulvescens TaxID=46160 RepID=A0ABP6D493_9ACTN
MELRAQWESVADDLLASVRPYAAGAEINLPGRASWSRCDGLEGFARTFLLAAFRVAGGGPAELLEPYAEGLSLGPATWPSITGRFQPMVESASLAIGLWLTREQLWDRLTPAVQEDLATWLGGALRHEPVDNNWRLFPVMVAGFLEAAGRPADPVEPVEPVDGLARIEPWYVGDGWYGDGPGRSFDHYNGWALHFYPVLLRWLRGEEPGVYGRRLAEFLDGYAHLFDDNGAMLYQGRSLTYRFGAAASFFLGALTGTTPLTPGQTRRVTAGVLRYFLERGALSDDGLLTLGWHGPHEATLQPYSGSASPYWAAKAFVGLLLPPDHRVWTDAEELIQPTVRALRGPGFVIQNPDGIARLLNHGAEGHPGDPLYDRLAYSTRTAPTGADNHFGLVIDGAVTTRGPLESLGADTEDDDLAWAASAHHPVERPEARIESVSVAAGPVELRLHRVHGFTGTVRQTGWAVTPDGPVAHLRPLAGFDRQETLLDPAGTAFGAPSTTLALEGAPADGIAASIVLLGAADEGGASVLHHGDRTDVVLGARRFTVVWPSEPDDETVRRSGRARRVHLELQR